MKREYTKFGEELKVLRTRRHQSIQDMADVLGVSKGFLSRVESGKKAVPGDWIDILCDHYHLKPYPRILAIKFEKYFDQIDEETADKIVALIDKS